MRVIETIAKEIVEQRKIVLKEQNKLASLESEFASAFDKINDLADELAL